MLEAILGCPLQRDSAGHIVRMQTSASLMATSSGLLREKIAGTSMLSLSMLLSSKMGLLAENDAASDWTCCVKIESFDVLHYVYTCYMIFVIYLPIPRYVRMNL